MPSSSPQASQAQTRHRATVGAIGLLIVVALIALASFVLRSVTRERPVNVPGGARQEIVANMAGDNQVAAEGAPLAAMGVTPGVKNENAPAR